MKITALCPWYGSNRMLASEVGKALSGCEWVGIPFAGGMSEVPHITARTIVVNDLHRHVMNLACVLAIEGAPEKLAGKLDSLPFHPDTLKAAQIHCQNMEERMLSFEDVSAPLSSLWALNYFVASWMGRSGIAGTDGEFKGGLPLRWNAGGGDSNTRYRSAIDSLQEWGKIMRRCNFSTLDFREFLAKCKDQKGHGIYCDPPFPEAGDGYKHKFTVEDHRELARLLGQFKTAKVVCRFHDHPLIRELYPDGEVHKHGWNRERISGGRNQANNETPELLIKNWWPA